MILYKLYNLWQFYKAKKLIIPWLKNYREVCNGQNRFLVSVELLQDRFREFDTVTIEQVFDELITQGIVVRDPYDGEWCIR